MEAVQTSMITLRLLKTEKDMFKLLAAVENKSVTALLKGLVEKELKSRKFTALELRKLPHELRSELLKQMTDAALPFYNKYKDELLLEDTGDGIL